MNALINQQQTMIFNHELALERVGGDEVLLSEIAVLFIADYPRCVDEILNAINAADAKALEAAAHGLKGAVSNFAAEPARLAAQQLEDMGRNGNLQDGREAFKALVIQLELLHPMLAVIAEAEASEQA